MTDRANINYSLTKELKEHIIELAKSEDRTVSGFLTHLVKKIHPIKKKGDHINGISK